MGIRFKVSYRFFIHTEESFVPCLVVENLERNTSIILKYVVTLVEHGVFYFGENNVKAAVRS